MSTRSVKKKAVKRSKYQGVSWNKSNSKWHAEDSQESKNHEAARVVKKFCKSHNITHVDISAPSAADNAVSTKSVKKKAVKQSKYKCVLGQKRLEVDKNPASNMWFLLLVLNFLS